jgi:hypothetical protein
MQAKTVCDLPRVFCLLNPDSRILPFPTYHLRPTTYRLPPTSFLFNNIPAFDA